MIDKKVFHAVSYGLYVVGSRRGEALNAQIANTIFQVSASPERVAVAIHKENLTHAFISESRVFSASVLSQDAPMEYVARFGFQSGRDADKFSGVEMERGETGAPIALDHAVGAIEVEVESEVDAGTHTLFVGRVRTARVIHGGVPMTYAHYHDVRKGRSPERAPVSQLDEEPSGPGKYRCTVCGYVHDPASSSPFEDTPEDWVCPVCGARRALFEPAD
jgi:flavin reductase (DIM6/NTAB) family NADH-FMN oxidoreductase RutF/rubredoxin